MEGTGGNHGYYFASGEYKYILYVNMGNSLSLGDLTVYRTDMSGYYEVKYESDDHDLLLAESILNNGTESHYQALLNRLRECSS